MLSAVIIPPSRVADEVFPVQADDPFIAVIDTEKAVIHRFAGFICNHFMEGHSQLHLGDE